MGAWRTLFSGYIVRTGKSKKGYKGKGKKQKIKIRRKNIMIKYDEEGTMMEVLTVEEIKVEEPFKESVRTYKDDLRGNQEKLFERFRIIQKDIKGSIMMFKK